MRMIFFIVQERGDKVKIFNKIRNFFSTPSRAYVEAKMPFFSFFNKDLATNETIFSAISMISNAVASAPVVLTDNYKKLKPSEHEVARLLKYGSGYQSMFQIIRLLETIRNVKGSAYAIKEYGYAGVCEKLWVLNSDCVTPVIERESREMYYRINEDGRTTYVHNSHIIAVNHISLNGYSAFNPLDVLRNTIDYDNEIKEFSINQMKNGLKARIIIKLQSKLSEDKLEEYNTYIENFKESGVLYIDAGKEIEELKSTSFIDPNVANVEKITVERVERAFNIPGKLTGKNTDSEDLLFLKDTILPIVRMYEQEFSLKLLSEHERDNGLEIKFSLNGFARANMQTRGNFYQIMFRNGLMTVNEIRALEDLPPVEEGNKRYISRDLCPSDLYDEFIKNQISEEVIKNE